MSRRSRRITIIVTLTAALLGSATAQAAATLASSGIPAPFIIAAFTQTEPPGPCTTEEVGQSKVGPDGEVYTCMPVSQLSQA